MRNCAGGMMNVAVLSDAAQLVAPDPDPKMFVARVTPSIFSERNLVAVPRFPRALTVIVAPFDDV